MKISLFFVSVLMFVITSCGHSAKNKVEATDSQKVASGSGEVLIVDTTASSIRWKGFKVGGGHDGVIGISNGELTINDSTATSGSFVIDMNTINAQDLTGDMKSKLEGHLKSADFFDVEKYPQSTFVITKVEAIPVPNDSITHMLSGNLKMKDVEKNITFGAKVTKEGDNYKAVTVPFTIDRTQWNVQYGSKSLFKDLKDKAIDDNIELQITIVAKPK